jgi:SAM-dependent methyltransferase
MNPTEGEQMNSTFSPADVAAYEHATWSRCAPTYRDGFAALTRGAVDPLLDAAAVGPGTRLLDIGTGTGTVAAAAHQRRASAIGIDFSDTMLSEARRSVPDVDFRAASADALPFDDESFDAVVGNVVLHHLGRPEAALEQAHRVLTRGGRVACTVWAGMETLAAFGVFFAAVEEHAAGTELPHGPLFGVADEPTLMSLFADAGFTDVTIDTVDTTWRMPSIEPLLRALGAWAQLDAFPPRTRQAIETSVRSSATAYETEDGLAIPNPMLLISATRPR